MEIKVGIEPGWRERLTREFTQRYFLELALFVRHAYKTTQVYPQPQAIFRAFDLCKFEATKVVILGQDPYHGLHQADGLCFSVQPEVAMPPSLVNIFQEIKNDLGKPYPAQGDLSRWAAQGVLLLNATLTVEAHKAGSHQNKGWEQFTDATIRVLALEKKGLVFMLWGSYAKKKGAFIDPERHLVLTAPHPSPLSVHQGFFGCRHFSRANAYLQAQGQTPIDW